MAPDQRIVVVIPVYNNGRTIASVVSGALRFVKDVIVVNDGSTDATAQAITAIAGIEIISVSQNRGKGNALRLGFDAALKRGFTHAITMDGDGQHLAQDLPVLLAEIEKSPDALIIGNRILPAAGVAQPKRSRFGRRFGAFWYRFHTGLHIDDTQCGFRAYPLASIAALGRKTERYEYELDVLIQAAWHRIPVKQVDIHIFYQPTEERVSHFRPVRDFLRLSGVNSKAAMTRIFFPWRFIDVPGVTFREKMINLVMLEIRAHHSPGRAAAALSLGTFLAIFPIHGFQMLTALGLSLALRLNRAICFLGVSISSAPLLPFWFAAGYGVGRAAVPAAAVSGIAAPLEPYVIKLPMTHVIERVVGTSFATGAIQWFLGSIILAILVGAVTFVIAFPAFRTYAKIRRKE